MFDDKTLADLAWPEVLAQLEARCHTSRGAAAARALVLLDDIDKARSRLSQVGELQTLHASAEPLPFGGIGDVTIPVVRAAKGGDLDADQLRAVSDTLLGCHRLLAYIATRKDALPALLVQIEPVIAVARQLANDVAVPIADAFDNDGRLSDRASERLGGLRRNAQRLQQEILSHAKALLDDPKLSCDLQDDYYTQRDDRYVLPVRSDASSGVHGIVHGTSQSGQTLFIEPASLVEPNNKLAIARSEIAAEERRIFAELTRSIRDHVEMMNGVLDAALILDVLDASAQLAVAMQATSPHLARDGPFHLVRARHPLLALAEHGCVPNDLALPPGTFVVISGPNAGGKTVALKTAGLAALMARAGLFVAADAGSCVPWFRVVYTDIGDAQSLERNLSTFSAHALRLQGMLDDADNDALVLIDEVAVGTAPEQGAALAQALLEAFVGRGARGLVTTHYERVKNLAASDPCFVSAAVGFDMDALEPTYVLTSGAPGASGGLMVARKLGVHSDVMDRADALLGRERSDIEALLAAAQHDRQRAAEQLEQARGAHYEAEVARTAATKSRDAALAHERVLRERGHTDAVASLRAARDELDQFVADLKRRRGKGGGDVAAARKQLAALAQRVHTKAPARPAPTGTVPTADALRAGMSVQVITLGATGTVVAPPARGKVIVQVGALRTTVALDAVRLLSKRAAGRSAASAARTSRAARLRTSGAHATFEEQVRRDDSAPARTPDNTIDVRGERVDDALMRFERFVDDSLMAERDVVFVIHGHGTGALKQAVRSQAKQHRRVLKWRRGASEQGGDGITALWLDVV